MASVPAFLIAKLLRFLTRLRGGGSALPGYVLLRLVPDALGMALGKLPRGVIFVTGSNGKSTTTMMLAALLKEHGLRVFSNPAGGNLPQGLASALVARASLAGTVRADIAVLEVDEAYGPAIAALVTPDWVVVTNIQVDQLNRFGEPEQVYRKVLELALGAKIGVVVNRSDPNGEALGSELLARGQRVETMELAPEVIAQPAHGLVSAPLFFDSVTPLEAAPSAVVTAVEGRLARLQVAGWLGEIELPAPGVHYAIDAGLAVAMAVAVVGSGFRNEALVRAFDGASPVYGRGETIQYRGHDFALTMMKNLPSLQANLDSMRGPFATVWLSVDEGTPDPSWIFDVDLGPLTHVDVLSGSKAWQWALLLEHRAIPYGQVIEDTREAFNAVVHLAGESSAPIQAIVNYEQMMLIRRIAGYRELEGKQ